jgi:hypothetical protein
VHEPPPFIKMIHLAELAASALPEFAADIKKPYSDPSKHLRQVETTAK